MANSKYYKIKYFLSTGRTIVHAEKRPSIMKEWEEILLLPEIKILRKLKLHKEKDITLKEVCLVDWVGNLMVNKLFGKDEEIKEGDCHSSAI